MAGDLTVLDGSTFFVSSESGDVEAVEAEGLFHADMRHLSRWPEGATISIRRDRFVADGLHEDLVVENAADEPRRLRLELCFGSDFADILECKRKPKKRGRSWIEIEESTARIVYERDGFRRETIVAVSASCQIEDGRAIFELELEPHDSWKTCIDVTPVVE